MQVRGTGKSLVMLVASFLICPTLALADTLPAVSPVGVPTSASTHPARTVAAADEYFGRLKMSVLGIQNVIRDMRLRVEADAEKTPTIFDKLAWVEDAIHDWEQQYPTDSWIPRDLLGLEATYLEGAGDRSRQMAIRTETWLLHDYPKSPHAAAGRDLLAKAPAVKALDTAPGVAIQPAGSSQPTAVATPHSVGTPH